MKNYKQIIHENHLIAIIINNKSISKGINFYTKPNNAFQIGIHLQDKGTKLLPHSHKISKPLSIKSIQEVLYVIKGKIKVNLYTLKGEKISSHILKVRESILLISGGHGVEFLENSKVYEVKQGPYPGVKKAKEYFQGDK